MPRVTIDELPEDTVVGGSELLVVQDGATTKKMPLSLLFDSASGPLDAHVADSDGAHAASAISATPSGGSLDGLSVQAQLGQVGTELNALSVGKVTNGGGAATIRALTQAAYDALTPDPNTVYFII